MKPYRIAEESDTHITYEYRTAYTWTLYAALLVLVAGMVIPNDPLTLIGGVAIAAYFAAKLALGGDAIEHRANQRQQGVVRQSTAHPGAEVMPNNRVESARVARPTRKREALLLAAQAGR